MRIERHKLACKHLAVREVVFNDGRVDGESVVGEKTEKGNISSHGEEIQEGGACQHHGSEDLHPVGKRRAG